MRRRDFLGAGALAAAGAANASVPLDGTRGSQERPVFHTALCEVLGVEYPILQAPMQSIATPRLVASVCEAGGMGILAGVGVPVDVLRQQIREVRTLTQRPFGVNLILHSAVRPPIDAATLGADMVRAANSVLNRFRARLGVPAVDGGPPSIPDLIPAAFEVILEESVPLFSTGLGLPDADMVSRCRARGIKVMAMVTTVADAIVAEARGVDVIAAQGAEAGGHRSTGVKPESPEHAAIGCMALVPQVAQSVRVPVVAAGGISNGRGLAAVLTLGAAGVLVGTRFIATEESEAVPFHKQALVRGNSDQTTLSDAFTGHYARFLRNEFIEQYRASGAPVLPPMVQYMAARDIIEAAARQGRPEFYPLYSGQGVGMIDSVPPAATIVRAFVEEARSAISALTRDVRTGKRG